MSDDDIYIINRKPLIIPFAYNAEFKGFRKQTFKEVRVKDEICVGIQIMDEERFPVAARYLDTHQFSRKERLAVEEIRWDGKDFYRPQFFHSYEENKGQWNKYSFENLQSRILEGLESPFHTVQNNTKYWRDDLVETADLASGKLQSSKRLEREAEIFKQVNQTVIFNNQVFEKTGEPYLVYKDTRDGPYLKVEFAGDNIQYPSNCLRASHYEDFLTWHQRKEIKPDFYDFFEVVEPDAFKCEFAGLAFFRDAERLFDSISNHSYSGSLKDCTVENFTAYAHFRDFLKTEPSYKNAEQMQKLSELVENVLAQPIWRESGYRLKEAVNRLEVEPTWENKQVQLGELPELLQEEQNNSFKR